MSDTMRQASNKDWNSADTAESLQIGCLQRIADATEKMASNYTRLQADCDMYKRLVNEEREACASLRRSNNALRGVIKRMKKGLKS